MPPIEIHFAVFVFLVAALFVFVFLACLYAWKARILLRRHDTLSKSYGELFAGSSKREATLLAEIKLVHDRALLAEADADRLAPLVSQNIKDIDDTAELLKDEHPPLLKAEREALLSHQYALRMRIWEHSTTVPPITPPHETTTKV